MDIAKVTCTAITNTFNILIEEGYSPSMEFKDGSLTIWTDDASAEFVGVIERERTKYGEGVFSIHVVQGEGELYLAEMIANEFVSVLRGDDE